MLAFCEELCSTEATRQKCDRRHGKNLLTRPLVLQERAVDYPCKKILHPAIGEMARYTGSAEGHDLMCMGGWMRFMGSALSRPLRLQARCPPAMQGYEKPDL